MNIRSRLLTLLLPLLIFYVGLVLSLCYVNWRHAIISNYQMRTQSVVATCAALLDEDNWSDLSRPASIENRRFIKNVNRISRQLPFLHLYAQPSTPLMIPGFALKEKEQISLLQQKKPIASTLYHSPLQKKTLMTAVAPVLDKGGKIAAFIIGDIDATSLNQKLDEAFNLMLMGMAITTVFVTASVFFVASRISQPVKKLKNAALAIAAGEYGRSIAIKGPKEIEELAGTLNTMSECLQEHIMRISKNAAVRQQKQNEQESCVLLQQQIWKQATDALQNAPLLFKTIDLFCNPSHGISLKVGGDAQDHFNIQVLETNKRGFSGLFELLTNPLNIPKQTVQSLIINFDAKKMVLDYHCEGFPAPLIWSTSKQALAHSLGSAKQIELEASDLIIIYNLGFLQIMQTEESAKEWLQKTLRHFATEGLDSCAPLFHKELGYLARKNPPLWDIHFLCFQILPG